MNRGIKFVQYLRPDGREKTAFVDRPPEVERRAEDLQNAGCIFESEVLTTGEVHLAISDGERDLAGRVVRNGPEVLEAVDDMVDEAWEGLNGD